MKNIKKLFKDLAPNELKSDCIMFLDWYQIDNQKYLRKLYTKKSEFINFSKMICNNDNLKVLKTKYAPRFIIKDTSLTLDSIENKYGINVERFNSCAIYRNQKEYFLDYNFKPLKDIDSLHIGGINEHEDKIVLKSNNFFLKLYKCGQASISSLHNENQIVALFDFGSTHKRNKEIVEFLYKLNKTDTKTYIIISHFDFDHINLYKKIDFRNKNFIFIIHECLLNPKTAAFACLEGLLYSNKCKVVKLLPGEIYKTNLFEVEPSHINPSVNLTDENQTSLFTKIEINKSKVYLPGDSMYENFPHHKMPTHILLPHHGSFINNPLNIEGVKAFVYAGHNKKYSHPRYEHLIYYKEDISRFDESDHGMIFDVNGEVKDDICKVSFKNSKIWNL